MVRPREVFGQHADGLRFGLVRRRLGAGRLPGQAPPTLLDYLPPDSLMFIDESHQTMPQIRGMWHGDRSRKDTLVQHGFRLPSALDNRPLTFEEFQNRVNQVVYVSATPGPYELEIAKGVTVEQIIRPTGLLDPIVEVRPREGVYDYANKYTPGRTEYLCPAPFPEDVTARVQDAALASFAAFSALPSTRRTHVHLDVKGNLINRERFAGE